MTGYIAQYDKKADVAIANRNNSNNIYYDAVIEGDGWGIGGVATNLENFIGSKEVAKMGITTGRRTGTIKAVNQTTSVSNSCVTLKGDGVEYDLRQAEGDSGSPVYWNSTYTCNGTKFTNLLGIATLGGSPYSSNYNCGGNSYEQFHHTLGYSAEAMANNQNYDIGYFNGCW
ncbi:MAG: hypothetical protein ABEI86_06750 [Halobacteriaceae archaeon]